MRIVTISERNSTIETLKLLLMFGVVILHVCGIQGKAIELCKGSAFDLHFLRSLFMCAVDCFIIISGYFLCTSYKRNFVKVLNLYIIAVFFSFSTNLVSSIYNNNFSLISILDSFLVGNYFLLLYSAIYILSPFINIIFNNINKRSFNLLLVIMFLMFSIYPTAIEYIFERDDNLIGYSFVSFFDGDGHGYTLVNFMFMYTIGAYLRKYGLLLNRKSVCLLIYVLSSTIIAIIMLYVNKTELNYFSPACIVAAIALFNFFALIKPTKYNIINYLSRTVFGIYIVHGYVISLMKRLIPIERIVDLSMFPRLFSIVIFALVVFIISMLISIVLNIIVDFIFISPLKRYKIFSYEVK